MIKYNTRFAPSPNGYLHLGHAYSALISSALARKSNGKFFIRIEDIDLGRCKNPFGLGANLVLYFIIIFHKKNLYFLSIHN